MQRRNRKWWTVPSAVFTALSTVLLLALPFAAIANAIPPTGGFMNPDDDGPGNRISDKNDGTDELYHIVLRATDPDGGTITSVEIQIEDGDADTNFETIGTATRVGTTDTWEFFWDVSAHTPTTDVDNDAGFIRALVRDSSNETAFIPSATGLAVVFMNATDETVEITEPDNGDALGFFNGTATLTGTASAGTDEVEVFYTTSPATGNQTWISCGSTTTFNVPDQKTGLKEWTAECTLAGGTQPNQVTGVAARAVDGVTDESGDAHRVTGYNQVVSQVTVTPNSDDQSVGFCNTYTVRVIDSLGNNVAGANVDVHATGPNDDLQFAINDAIEGTRSDDFTAPDGGTHTYEPAGGCDQAGESDGRPDDYDDQDTSDGLAESGDAGAQGVHVVGDATAPDTHHIEGLTDPDGFQFSIASNTTGTTNILAWYDSTENDVHDTGSEQSGTASKAWQAQQAVNVEAEPEGDQNPTGTPHSVQGRVTDQNGNPVSGQTIHFRVTGGPHSDNDLDDNVGTPNGYFGSCVTGADGRCSQSYTGNEIGTDTIVVWIDEDGDLTPDAGERQDTVTKRWFRGEITGQVCIDLDPNDELNPTTTSHQLVAFVTDGTLDATGDAADQPGEIDNDCSGNPLSDVGVRFTITDDNPEASLSPDTNGDPDSETVVTGPDGQATVTLTNDNGNSGNNNVAAQVLGTGTYVFTETNYNFEDIAATGTNQPVDCDDCFVTVPIGFTFNYYGVAETDLHVSSNGFLCMGSSLGCASASPDPIPSTDDPDGIIAGFWADLVDDAAADIFTQTLGTAPNRRFIVQYENLRHFGTGVRPVTFQIKLFEGSDRIEVHYEDAQDDGSFVAAGVEDYTGTDGTQFFFTNNIHLQNQAVQYFQRTTAAPTGTFSEEIDKDWAVAGEAAKLECTPAEDLNATGSSHIMTARVTDAFGDPVADQAVDFEVFAGPHADNDLDADPATPTGHFGDQGMTDGNGQATASYTGSEVGRDDIRCFVDENDNDTADGGELQDTASKNWQTAATISGANVEIDMEDCDGPFGAGYGGADWESTSSNPTGQVHRVCVSVADASGNFIRGANVTLSSSGVGVITDADGPPPSSTTATNVVDADGRAEFWIHSNTSGTQTLTATAEGVTDSDTGTKTWEAPPASEARVIDCGPETDTNPPGTDHEVICVVTDGLGNRVPGVAVTWTKADSGGANSAFVFQQNTTDGNGEARATINSGSEGTTQLTGAISAAATECDEAADQPHAGDAGKPAGTCSDTVSKTWQTPQPSQPGQPGGPGGGTDQGYWMVASDGGIFSFGNAAFYGSTGAITLNSPIVGMDNHPANNGYWLFAADGGVFGFGSSAFYGSMGGTTLNRPVVGGAATPSGEGYYLVASDGGIFSFGDATFFGSTGAITLNSPIVDMAVTPTGKGYWLFAADGGVFAFGDARFFGSMGATRLNRPVVGADNTQSGAGYWEVASDGGIFSFGDADFFGSTGNITLNSPIEELAGTGSDKGYWMFAADGGVFAFGNATFQGSMGGTRLNRPVVGGEATNS